MSEVEHTDGGPELTVTVSVSADGEVTVTDATASGGPRSVVLRSGDTTVVTVRPWDW